MPHIPETQEPAYGGQSGVKPPHSKAGEAPAGERQSGVKPPHFKGSRMSLARYFFIASRRRRASLPRFASLVFSTTF